MTNKTRKHIWPVPLVASMAIIRGAGRVGGVVANNPGVSPWPITLRDPCAECMTDHEARRFPP